LINPTITIENNEISINFLIKNNASKIRLKERKNEMGERFLTLNEALGNENAYIEWQIGYDTKVKSNNDYKIECLKGNEYIYYKQKKDKTEKKYPAELMVIIKYALDLGFLTKEDIKDILDKVDYIYDKDMYLDNHPIIGKDTGIFLYDDFKIFNRILPMAILKEKDYFIEMERKQMQYAAGYQVMVYVCPYFKSLNKKSHDTYSWIIDKGNIDIFKKVLLSFSLASKQHNRDIKDLVRIIIS